MDNKVVFCPFIAVFVSLFSEMCVSLQVNSILLPDSLLLQHQEIQLVCCVRDFYDYCDVTFSLHK